MKQYELTVLIHPDLEMNLAPATDKVKKLIEDNGGKITKETNEGKKHLAYPINGQDFAVYYYYEVELPAEAPNKLSAAMNISEELLRYLLVRADERKAKYEAARKARKADDESAEEESSEEETDNNSNEEE